MDFVIVANAWGAGMDNPTSKHQIALELARQDHRVLWVEGAGMRSPSLGSGSDRGRILRKIMKSLRPATRVPCEGLSIWGLAPLLIPIPSNVTIRLLNSWIYFLTARLWCILLRFRSPVLINYVPVLAEVERLWGGRRRPSGFGGQAEVQDQKSDGATVVYHCVDRWDSFGTYDTEMMRKVDEDCCRYADVVIASASDLFERCKTYNANTYLVRHGVNYEHFAGALGLRHERPNDLPGGPTVGFFGLLSEWVDQDLLITLARTLRGAGEGVPQSEASPISDLRSSTSRRASVVLIGRADVDISRLEAEANIHILGPKPFADLPAYAAWFDVGVIPFVVNELTSAVNPIKLREMIAAGCPVVSTPMREVEVCVQQLDEGATVSLSPAEIGHSHEEFITAVTTILSNPIDAADRRRISLTGAAETWSTKVGEILRLL